MNRHHAFFLKPIVLLVCTLCFGQPDLGCAASESPCHSLEENIDPPSQKNQSPENSHNDDRGGTGRVSHPGRKATVADSVDAQRTVAAISAVIDASEKMLAGERNARGHATPEELIQAVMTMPCDRDCPSCIEKELLRAKAYENRRNPGIDFVAGYQYESDDEEDDLPDAYAGVSWNLFGSGLYENRSLGRQLAYAAEIAELKSDRQRLFETAKCREAALIFYFSALRLSILKEKYEFLTHCVEIATRAYFGGEMLYDDLLKFAMQKEQTSQLIQHITSQRLPETHIHLSEVSSDPAILNIDLEAVRYDVLNDPTGERVLALERNMIREKNRKLLKNRLKLFVGAETNGEDDSDGPAVNFAASIRFTAPLASTTDAPVALELMKRRAEKNKSALDQMHDLERLYNAYGEKLGDAVEMEYKKKIVLERLRRDLLFATLGAAESDVISLCGHALELMDVKIERIAILESLYRRLLDFFSSTGVLFREKFVFHAGIGNLPERGRAGNRSVYIWSEFFNAGNNSLLIEWMRGKSITCAVVSLSKQVQMDKLKRFLDSARENGIRVELMGSENQWVRPENAGSLISFLARASSLADVVHLDIEPHTFSDFDINRKRYEEQYVRMIKTAARYLEETGTALSASVPFWLDPEVILQVAPYLDRIFVMAYGTNDSGIVSRRLKPFLSVDPAKLVAAIRPADFESELEIETFIEMVMKSNRITQFAFHDLSSLIEVVGR